MNAYTSYVPAAGLVSFARSVEGRRPAAPPGGRRGPYADGFTGDPSVWGECKALGDVLRACEHGADGFGRPF